MGVYKAVSGRVAWKASLQGVEMRRLQCQEDKASAFHLEIKYSDDMYCNRE
jgi:hypothetical protein